MQKKQLNSVLIVIVVAIWGGLIYKFVTPHFSKNRTPVNIPKAALVTKETRVLSKDTFELNELVRDPFLAKSFYKPLYKNSPKKTTKKKLKSKKIVWPKITYLGFVKAQTNKNKLGLLRIDKKLHKVRPSDKIENIRVIKITNDSIGLKLGNQKKYFKK